MTLSIFADDTSLFSVVNKVNRTAEDFNRDLETVISSRRLAAIFHLFLCLIHDHALFLFEMGIILRTGGG